MSARYRKENQLNGLRARVRKNGASNGARALSAATDSLQYRLSHGNVKRTTYHGSQTGLNGTYGQQVTSNSYWETESPFVRHELTRDAKRCGNYNAEHYEISWLIDYVAEFC